MSILLDDMNICFIHIFWQTELYNSVSGWFWWTVIPSNLNPLQKQCCTWCSYVACWYKWAVSSSSRSSSRYFSQSVSGLLTTTLWICDWKIMLPDMINRSMFKLRTECSLSVLNNPWNHLKPALSFRTAASVVLYQTSLSHLTANSFVIHPFPLFY